MIHLDQKLRHNVRPSPPRFGGRRWVFQTLGSFFKSFSKIALFQVNKGGRLLGVVAVHHGLCQKSHGIEKSTKNEKKVLSYFLISGNTFDHVPKT